MRVFVCVLGPEMDPFSWILILSSMRPAHTHTANAATAADGMHDEVSIHCSKIQRWIRCEKWKMHPAPRAHSASQSQLQIKWADWIRINRGFDVCTAHAATNELGDISSLPCVRSHFAFLFLSALFASLLLAANRWHCDNANYSRWISEQLCVCEVRETRNATEKENEQKTTEKRNYCHLVSSTALNIVVIVDAVAPDTVSACDSWAFAQLALHRIWWMRNASFAGP